MRRVPVSRYGLVGPLVLLAVGALAAGERAAGTVASLSGSATVARTGLAKPANLAVRDDLFVRDRITTGKESLIRVLLGGQTTVTARELSVVTLTDTADRARVGLDAGGAALDVAPVRAASARPIEVRTPNAIAAVRGTVLTVEVLRLSGRGATFVTTVSVFTGAVDVMASRVPSPKRVRVNAGQSVVVTGDVVGPVRPIDGVTARRLVADFALTGPGTRPLPGATARPPDQPGGVAGVGIAGPGAPGTVPSAGGPRGARRRLRRPGGSVGHRRGSSGDRARARHIEQRDGARARLRRAGRFDDTAGNPGSALAGKLSGRLRRRGGERRDCDHRHGERRAVFGRGQRRLDRERHRGGHGVHRWHRRLGAGLQPRSCRAAFARDRGPSGGGRGHAAHGRLASRRDRAGVPWLATGCLAGRATPAGTARGPGGRVGQRRPGPGGQPRPVPAPAAPPGHQGLEPEQPAADQVGAIPMRDANDSLGSLVDVDRGIISREIFVNEDIYHQELEKRVRARLAVRRPREPDPEARRLSHVSRMGEESVILCRDRAATIHVFLNSCRHRGMKVCRYDAGQHRRCSSARTTAGATPPTARWSGVPL